LVREFKRDTALGERERGGLAIDQIAGPAVALNNEGLSKSFREIVW